MHGLKVEIEKIVNNRTLGSSIILDKIIKLLYKASYSSSELNLIFSHLKAINKSMILVHHFLDSLKPHIKTNFYHSLAEYQLKWSNVEKTIAENLYSKILISKISPLEFLTHSHSGVLIKVLEILLNKGVKIEVIQTKSFPGGEGKLQADMLRRIGIKVRLIDDDEFKGLLNRISACLLGVDQYDEHGFINKVGSAKLISYCTKLNIPVYILGDSRKHVSACNLSNSSMFEYTEFTKKTVVISEKSI